MHEICFVIKLPDTIICYMVKSRTICVFIFSKSTPACLFILTRCTPMYTCFSFNFVSEKIKKQEQRKENKENIPYSSAVSHYSFTDPGQGHKPDQHNTLSRSQDAVSLFIFSDNKEMCQNAIDAIQCSITEQLEGTAQSHFTDNQSYVNVCNIF